MRGAETWALACFGLLLAACPEPQPSEEPGAGVALCCKATGAHDNSFVGCRRQPRICRASESVWARGPFVCVEQGTPGCAEGLCCELTEPSEPTSKPGEPEPGPDQPPQTPR